MAAAAVAVVAVVVVVVVVAVAVVCLRVRASREPPPPALAGTADHRRAKLAFLLKVRAALRHGPRCIHLCDRHAREAEEAPCLKPAE